MEKNLLEQRFLRVLRRDELTGDCVTRSAWHPLDPATCRRSSPQWRDLKCSVLEGAKAELLEKREQEPGKEFGGGGDCVSITCK